MGRNINELKYKMKQVYYCEKSWKSLKCVLLSEERESEKLKCCVSPTVQHGESKAPEAVGKSQLAGAGNKNGMEQKEQGKTLYDTIMVGTCHHALVQTCTHSIPWANLNVNYVLGCDNDVSVQVHHF